jgi:hypothetical protein
MFYVLIKNKFQLRTTNLIVFCIFELELSLELASTSYGFFKHRKNDSVLCLISPIETMLQHLASCFGVLVYFLLVFRLLHVYGKVYQARAKNSSQVRY